MSRETQVGVHMDKDLKQRLRYHAALNGCSMSTIVERLVRQHLDLADALDKEESPSETHNLKIVTGEHEIPKGLR